MKKMISFIGAIIFATTLFVACDEVKDEITTGNEKETANEDILMETTERSLDMIVEEVVDANKPRLAAPAVKVAIVTYPNITVRNTDPTKVYPLEITVDYGPTNVTINTKNGQSTKMRGKIVITVSDAYFTTNATRKVTTSDLYVNDYKVVYSVTLTNKGLQNNKLRFTRIGSTSITDLNNRTLERSSELDFVMETGSDTPTVLTDDSYTISGTATGKRPLGMTFKHVLTNVLVKAGCKHPVSGTLYATNSFEIGSFTIDYGNGECDNIVVVSDQIGNKYTVTIGE